MVQISWTNQAVIDLKNIYEFIASDSKSYAKREVLKIKFQTKQIQKYIQIGRVVPEYSRQDIRELIYGHYRIVYLVISDLEVDILTVHHSAKENLNIKDNK